MRYFKRNTYLRPPPSDAEPPTRDVYIALTPQDGIPALAGDQPGTGTGTSGWGDVPGSAYCYIYKVDPGTGALVGVHHQVLVLNLNRVAIPGDTWVKIVQEKFSVWLIDGPYTGSGSSSFSLLLRDNLGHSDADCESITFIGATVSGSNGDDSVTINAAGPANAIQFNDGGVFGGDSYGLYSGSGQIATQKGSGDKNSFIRTNATSVVSGGTAGLQAFALTGSGTIGQSPTAGTGPHVFAELSLLDSSQNAYDAAWFGSSSIGSGGLYNTVEICRATVGGSYAINATSNITVAAIHAFNSVGTIAIEIASSTFAVDVTAGSIRTPGTSGNTFRWNSSTTATSTQTLAVLPLTIYGGDSTTLMGGPTKWLLINQGGTNYKVPAY